MNAIVAFNSAPAWYPACCDPAGHKTSDSPITPATEIAASTLPGLQDQGGLVVAFMAALLLCIA
ncbi:MAG: hypothetical protein GY903_26900 [Fuerstiella sp.]|nr:hypothetical protein [Fuerstiella sp.]MCP4858127.1 hypothetical protein [Fuerstiella sp.]